MTPEHQKVLEQVISEERIHLRRLTEMAISLVPRISGPRQAAGGAVADLDLLLDQDGFLKDFEKWNEEVAREIAVREGIDVLSEEHLEVLRSMREYYKMQHTLPVLRMVCKQLTLEKACIYEMFLMDPVKAVKIAGLPQEALPLSSWGRTWPAFSRSFR
ncbi:MAG: TusE/DsrC/DsvC family sulfur relay protein [Deltaproteobacteria bacterium]|nr:TusE/DsrC/DsvC family sulfur relay protein [Deltaproteobacteria bacterium]